MEEEDETAGYGIFLPGRGSTTSLTKQGRVEFSKGPKTGAWIFGVPCSEGEDPVVCFLAGKSVCTQKGGCRVQGRVDWNRSSVPHSLFEVLKKAVQKHLESNCPKK